MLPNHTPLRVAEVFHTLEALHPGRIDLGIGPRAGHRSRPRRARCGRSTATQFPEPGRASCWRCRGGRFRRSIRSRTVRVVPADVRAAADLGAGVERRDRRVRRLDGPRLRLRAALQPHAARPADSRVSRALPAVGAVSRAARHPGRLGDLRADRRGGRLSRRVLATWAGCGCTGASSRRCRAPRRPARYEYSPQERVVVEMNRLRHFIGTPPKVASLMRQIAAGHRGRRDDGDVDDLRAGRAAAVATSCWRGSGASEGRTYPRELTVLRAQRTVLRHRRPGPLRAGSYPKARRCR